MQDVITTVVIDEVHNRSAHSDYVLALTLAATQKHSHLRLVLMSATGDHSLVEERIPQCQQLVMKGVMHHVIKGAFWIIRWINLTTCLT